MSKTRLASSILPQQAVLQTCYSRNICLRQSIVWTLEAFSGIRTNQFPDWISDLLLELCSATFKVHSLAKKCEIELWSIPYCETWNTESPINEGIFGIILTRAEQLSFYFYDNNNVWVSLKAAEIKISSYVARKFEWKFIPFLHKKKLRLQGMMRTEISI